MDGIGGSSSLPSKVLVVACTNQPLDSIDAALLRPGRLDHHVELKTPVTLDDAVTILQLYLTRKNIKSIDQRKHENAHEQTAPAAAAAAACTHSLLHDEVDLQVIAGRALQGRKLSVVTGASLEGLARQAILSALQRSMADVSKGHDSDEVIQVTMQDFDEALSRV
jgi:SpoVK/Ycf46/Vps4 family AAA+-type ATPase